MGMSLQDQLLKAGIADKKQANKARQEKRAKQKKKGKKAAVEPNKARQDQLAQAKRSQELNRKHNLEKEKQERLAQVRQLIETNRLDLRKCEAPYYFAVDKKIKKLYVDENIAKKLSLGQLAIVELDERFEIVPAKVASQIGDRDQSSLIVCHEPESPPA